MTEEVQLSLARRFDVAQPWRWEIVRPLDRYGEAVSPEFATEEQAREHARRAWGGALGHPNLSDDRERPGRSG